MTRANPKTTLPLDLGLQDLFIFTFVTVMNPTSRLLVVYVRITRYNDFPFLYFIWLAKHQEFENELIAQERNLITKHQYREIRYVPASLK
jgi:hypothetical protein